MIKKESYRGNLPHFQQPGQWYFITCSLEGAIPRGALEKYSTRLETARLRYHQFLRDADRDADFPKSVNTHRDPDFPKSVECGKSPQSVNFGEKGFSPSRNSGNELAQAKKEYLIALLKYRLAFDKILNESLVPGINLSREINRILVEEALSFFEGKRLNSHAWCIMPNHFHWVVSLFNKNEKGEPVYLQDILHSVKLFSARRINRNENLSGQLWMHESFETTIRNDYHFVQAVNYTLNNPVKAGLVKNWKEWPGTRTFPSP